MTNSTTVQAMTNDTPNSCIDVQCGCPEMWSLAQQFCYTRLSNKKQSGRNQYHLIHDVAARARRIAGTYARFYLEQEEHGDPHKKGRYYWMALGAFASKTVACSMEIWQVRSTSLVNRTVLDALAQGNFWLFNDIAAWHWYYNVSPDSFAQCLDKRDTDHYVDEVKSQVKKLPWAEDSLKKINNLKKTSEVIKGFELVKEIERSPLSVKRQDSQLDHLIVMARHEQNNILQKLIYDNKDFAWWIQVQRNDNTMDPLGRVMGIAGSLFSPQLKVSFVSACDTDLPEYSDVAPEDTKLEEFKSRMVWIGRVAKKFHGLMIKHPKEMEASLQTMAGWYNTPDPFFFPVETGLSQ